MSVEIRPVQLVSLTDCPRPQNRRVAAALRKGNTGRAAYYADAHDSRLTLAAIARREKALDDAQALRMEFVELRRAVRTAEKRGDNEARETALAALRDCEFSKLAALSMRRKAERTAKRLASGWKPRETARPIFPRVALPHSIKTPFRKPHRTVESVEPSAHLGNPLILDSRGPHWALDGIYCSMRPGASLEAYETTLRKLYNYWRLRCNGAAASFGVESDDVFHTVLASFAGGHNPATDGARLTAREAIRRAANGPTKRKARNRRTTREAMETNSAERIAKRIAHAEECRAAACGEMPEFVRDEPLSPDSAASSLSRRARIVRRTRINVRVQNRVKTELAAMGYSAAQRSEVMRRRPQTVDFAYVPPESVAVMDADDSYSRVELTRETFEALPDTLRNVAQCLAGGLTQSETARELGVNEMTVSRAVAKLRDAFAFAKPGARPVE